MVGNVIKSMIDFWGVDRKRVSHALKVYGYTLAIADGEGLPADLQEALLPAAVLHDVGIKIAEERFGKCTYDQQEELGPPAAAGILEKLGFSSKVVDRVKFLISRHHTPDASGDADFRALIEADFIVNFEEGNIPMATFDEVRSRHFRSATGKALLDTLFGE